MKINATKFVLTTLAAGLLSASSAFAAPFYTGALVSTDRAASVTFEQSGTNLVVTLTNTWTGDTLVPTDVLTAVFFSLLETPALGRTSALLNTGSTVNYDPQGQPAGGIVGGEWAYKSGLAGAPHGADEGISSSGLGLFAPGDRFPGDDLQKPADPDGVQYGLLSASDNSATGNGGITGSGGLIKNSVVFTLSGLTSGKTYAASDVTNVSFQWGTALDERNCTVDGDCGGTPTSGEVPEPGTLSLLGGSLLIGCLSYARRRKVRARV